jgi:hypothetical protein
VLVVLVALVALVVLVVLEILVVLVVLAILVLLVALVVLVVLVVLVDVLMLAAALYMSWSSHTYSVNHLARHGYCEKDALEQSVFAARANLGLA